MLKYRMGSFILESHRSLENYHYSEAPFISPDHHMVNGHLLQTLFKTSVCPDRFSTKEDFLLVPLSFINSLFPTHWPGESGSKRVFLEMFSFFLPEISLVFNSFKSLFPAWGWGVWLSYCLGLLPFVWWYAEVSLENNWANFPSLCLFSTQRQRCTFKTQSELC